MKSNANGPTASLPLFTDMQRATRRHSPGPNGEAARATASAKPERVGTRQVHMMECVVGL